MADPSVVIDTANHFLFLDELSSLGSQGHHIPLVLFLPALQYWFLFLALFYLPQHQNTEKPQSTLNFFFFLFLTILASG